MKDGAIISQAELVMSPVRNPYFWVHFSFLGGADTPMKQDVAGEGNLKRTQTLIDQEICSFFVTPLHPNTEITCVLNEFYVPPLPIYLVVRGLL